MKRVLISIVIPVFNEEQVLPLMRQRLESVLASIGEPVEIVLVDDGSSDGTVAIIREIACADARYRGVILSRNYGHQLALTAGLDFALGEAVVVLDADLQDPPELIPKMVEKWREGFHVVYGKRVRRESDSIGKKVTATLFYRMIRLLSGVNIPENAGDFRLMDRKVVDALRRMPERFRFIRGMVSWVGFRQCALTFERPQRAAGTTKYPWGKMFRFALDAIFAFSVVPLRLASYLGFAATMLAVVLIIRTLYLRYWLHSVIPGFSATFVAQWLLGGLNLMFMGILGEYIGRIYVEIKGRPLYLVQELVAPEGDHPVETG